MRPSTWNVVGSNMTTALSFPVVLIHDHDTILPRYEHAVARRVRDDVVPAAVPAQGERVRDLVWPGCLSHEARHGAQGEDKRETTHRSSSQQAPGPGGVRRRRTTMRITTRTTTRITPNCQFIESPLGNEKKAPHENSLDRRTQPLGEETPEPIDLFRLREAPLGDNVEDQIGLVYHEQRGSFLPASQMIPRQPVGAVGVARLDTAVGADGLEWELEIALLTVDPTDAPGNIEEAHKQLHAGDQQDEHQRWQSGAAVLHGNVCGEQRANPQQDPEHDPQHALPTARPHVELVCIEVIVRGQLAAELDHRLATGPGT